jgi:hypothetical protein
MGSTRKKARAKAARRPAADKRATTGAAAPNASKRARASKPAKAVERAKPAAAAKPAKPSAPALDDIEAGRRLLAQVTSLVEKANDRDAAQILGGGALESLLAAVLPQKRRPSHSVYQFLIGHKQRASLMAQVRNAINERFSFEAPDGVSFVSPTRVQWFYDGLTFREGAEPFSGVVGLFRDGELGWGLGVVDAAPGTSLGPAISDFVTVEQARKSFRTASAEPATGLSELLALVPREDEAPESVAGEYATVLRRHPWMLGAQHVAIETHAHRDANLPSLTAVRASDGARDVVVVEPPSLGIVGKTGKILSAFSDSWHRAQRTLTFVQRQADYLRRELGMKIDQPRCLLIAGAGLGEREREIVRREREAHDASIRLLTYDDLHRLAERTLAFFEPRL